MLYDCDNAWLFNDAYLLLVDGSAKKLLINLICRGSTSLARLDVDPEDTLYLANNLGQYAMGSNNEIASHSFQSSSASMDSSNPPDCRNSSLSTRTVEVVMKLFVISFGNT